MPGFSGGVGSSVGGAAGDNGSGGGGGQYGGRTGGLFGGTVSGVGLGGAGYNASDLARAQAFARDSGIVGTVTRNGVTYGTDRNGNVVANVSSASGSALAAALQAAVNGTSLSGSNGGRGNNGGNSGGSAGGSAGGGGNGFAPAYSGNSYADLQNQIAQLQQTLTNPRVTGYDKVMKQATLYSMQQEVKNREAAGFTSGMVGERPASQSSPAGQPQQQDNSAQQAAQAAAQAAQAQQAAAQAQQAQQAAAAAAAEQARQAEAARVAEQQRQQRIQAETSQRQNLQQQLGQTDSADATRALVGQINGLGSEADNASSLNKSLMDAANQRLQQQVAAQGSNAIGAAQAAQRAATSTTTGPNTALFSSKISQSVGTPVSLDNQQANAAEAARMGGYNDTSTMGRIGAVAKAALGGLGVAGPVGGLLSGAAAVYSNFVSDRQSASSRALTEGTAAPKAGIGDVLAGAAKGALTGAALGPLGALAGLVAGGAIASGTAPTAADLKGINPTDNGVTASPDSYGPGQTLVNGQRIGQGNEGGYKPGSLGSVFAGGGFGPSPTAPTQPTTGGNTGNTGGTTTPGAGSGNSGIDDRNKAGQSAFSSFIDDLRKRQMNNLLYTSAGWNGTSGTSLLGRVSGSQGAVGGTTGQVISQYGGGQSLLGGAWRW